MRNRRSALKYLLAALAVAVASCNTQAVLAEKGPVERELSLVFFSDVHARTEWGTPEAMARAAVAINAQQADLIIAGGDLITDGFQSSAASVESRWDAYMAMHNALEDSRDHVRAHAAYVSRFFLGETRDPVSRFNRPNVVRVAQTGGKVLLKNPVFPVCNVEVHNTP